MICMDVCSSHQTVLSTRRHPAHPQCPPALILQTLGPEPATERTKTMSVYPPAQVYMLLLYTRYNTTQCHVSVIKIRRIQRPNVGAAPVAAGSRHTIYVYEVQTPCMCIGYQVLLYLVHGRWYLVYLLHLCPRHSAFFALHRRLLRAPNAKRTLP